MTRQPRLWLVVLAVSLVWTVTGRADGLGQGAASVCRIPSHGGSGVVVFTEPGRTLLLTAGHLFAGAGRNRAILLDLPAPASGPPQSPGVRLLCLDERADLALLELAAGPVPFVAPVATAPRRGAWSVGFDEMAAPAVIRPAHEVSTGELRTTTLERPWHGRSGGALLSDSGELVGICSAYTGPSDHREVEEPFRGVYSSQQAIVVFWERCRSGGGTPQPFHDLKSPPWPAVPFLRPG